MPCSTAMVPRSTTWPPRPHHHGGAEPSARDPPYAAPQPQHGRNAKTRCPRPRTTNRRRRRSNRITPPRIVVASRSGLGEARSAHRGTGSSAPGPSPTETGGGAAPPVPAATAAGGSSHRTPAPSTSRAPRPQPRRVAAMAAELLATQDTHTHPRRKPRRHLPREHARASGGSSPAAARWRREGSRERGRSGARVSPWPPARGGDPGEAFSTTCKAAIVVQYFHA